MIKWGETKIKRARTSKSVVGHLFFYQSIIPFLFAIEAAHLSHAIKSIHSINRSYQPAHFSYVTVLSPHTISPSIHIITSQQRPRIDKVATLFPISFYNPEVVVEVDDFHGGVGLSAPVPWQELPYLIVRDLCVGVGGRCMQKFVGCVLVAVVVRKNVVTCGGGI